MDWVKTIARRDEKHLIFGIWCAYFRGLTVALFIPLWSWSKYYSLSIFHFSPRWNHAQKETVNIVKTTQTVQLLIRYRNTACIYTDVYLTVRGLPPENKTINSGATFAKRKHITFMIRALFELRNSRFYIFQWLWNLIVSRFGSKDAESPAKLHGDVIKYDMWSCNTAISRGFMKKSILF